MIGREKEIEAAEVMRAECARVVVSRVTILRDNGTKVEIKVLSPRRRITGLRYPHFISAAEVELGRRYNDDDEPA